MDHSLPSVDGVGRRGAAASQAVARHARLPSAASPAARMASAPSSSSAARPGSVPLCAAARAAPEGLAGGGGLISLRRLEKSQFFWPKCLWVPSSAFKTLEGIVLAELYPPHPKKNEGAKSRENNYREK